MLIRYCGPFAAVDVPELDVANLARLSPVDADEAIAGGLIESGAWELAPVKPAKTAADSAEKE